jgi:hypothetical protein
MVKCWDVE